MEKGSKSERGDMIINEDTVYTADEESLHPASKEAEPLKDDEAMNLDENPAEYSDEDDDPKNIALNKQALLEWLTVADFTQEISLTKVANHKFKLDGAEIEAMIGTEGILKICKVLMYKVGLTYKRMDIYFNELRDEFK